MESKDGEKEAAMVHFLHPLFLLSLLHFNYELFLPTPPTYLKWLLRHILYLNIPLFRQSVGTPLLPHQKQALSWMCARENKSGLPPFWEKRGELYYNTLTCFSAKEIPERVRGGILADDMGLGKTLTTIALILTNFHNGKPLPVETCVSVAILKVHFTTTM